MLKPFLQTPFHASHVLGALRYLIQRWSPKFASGIHLLPLTLSEFRAHAIELERHAETRYGEYAMRMRYLGARRAADGFERLRMLEKEEVKRLESEGEEQGECRSPLWSCVSRIAHFRYAPEPPPAGLPQNAQSALSLAIAMEKRARAYYRETVRDAREAAVRACANRMLRENSIRLVLLDRLLALETSEGWQHAASFPGDGTKSVTSKPEPEA